MLCLGIENRLVACATFEKSYDRPSEKVFFLSLLAVRKKFRHIGIGSFLLKQIINPKVTGDHDVIVVNAEKDSVGFFEKYGNILIYLYLPISNFKQYFEFCLFYKEKKRDIIPSYNYLQLLEFTHFSFANKINLVRKKIILFSYAAFINICRFLSTIQNKK